MRSALVTCAHKVRSSPSRSAAARRAQCRSPASSMPAAVSRAPVLDQRSQATSTRQAIDRPLLGASAAGRRWPCTGWKRPSPSPESVQGRRRIPAAPGWLEAQRGLVSADRPAGSAPAAAAGMARQAASPGNSVRRSVRLRRANTQQVGAGVTASLPISQQRLCLHIHEGEGPARRRAGVATRLLKGLGAGTKHTRPPPGACAVFNKPSEAFFPFLPSPSHSSPALKGRCGGRSRSSSRALRNRPVARGQSPAQHVRGQMEGGSRWTAAFVHL